MKVFPCAKQEKNKKCLGLISRQLAAWNLCWYNNAKGSSLLFSVYELYVAWRLFLKVHFLQIQIITILGTFIDSYCKMCSSYNIRTAVLLNIIMYLFCWCSCTQNKWNIPHYQDKLILSSLALVYLKTLQFYYLRESPTEVLSHHLYFLNTYDTAITLLK